MKKTKRHLLISLLSSLLALPTAAQTPSISRGELPAQEAPLSLHEAVERLKGESRSLQIAEKGVAMAKNERGRLNAFWYPSLQSSGAFIHLSQKIEVKQPLSQFTDPAKEFVHSLLPDDQLISSILDQIGSHTLVFPLAPRNVTTVDLSAEWVLFAGGKRLWANRIGNTMVALSQENRAQVSATQQLLLVESYYGLSLARQVINVRKESYNGMCQHYENALKLEASGMIDKAGRLFAQVNRDEAQRELEAACKDEEVAQSALQALLNQAPTEGVIIPTSPLFLNDSLPSKWEFDTAVSSGNSELNQLRLQELIAHQQTRIDRSGYLPTIALFGKQTLYAKGIQPNLMPRTLIGVGFTWNLFDGLDREKRIRQSKLTEQSLALGQEKARSDLSVAVEKLYGQLEKAHANVRALNATIALSEELVRIRKRSFAEGMATSTEVVDAETMQAKVRVARLAAYYEYDVTLMSLFALCGTPELFERYSTP